MTVLQQTKALKLTSSLHATLKDIEQDRGALLVSQIRLASREADLNALISAGFAIIIGHSIVEDRTTGTPAKAVEITEAGRAALAEAAAE